MRDFVAAATARLVASLPAETRFRLAHEPIPALEGMGVCVLELDSGLRADVCSCDGAYFALPYVTRPTITYLRTPGSRRQHFTLLHELGHHLVRSRELLLSEIADYEGDRDQLEERICDAFAGLVLIPDEVLQSVVGNRRPVAADLRNLFDACQGSREACAVRLAQRLRCDGYVALLDPKSRSVRFASPSPECGYPWARGTLIPPDHHAWSVISTGVYRGEGEVAWASRHRRNYWLDAVLDGGVIHAVFASDRYWVATGLGILSDPSRTVATPMLMSGHCAHCRARVFGTHACDKCGDVTCRTCGRCGCGAPQRSAGVCNRCHLRKARSQFRLGSALCRECETT